MEFEARLPDVSDYDVDHLPVPDSTDSLLGGVVIEIDPQRCDVFAGNGRADTRFDLKKNAALVADIGRRGQLMPVIVRQNGERFEVVAGTRRLGAILQLCREGYPRTLKAIVRELTDEQAWTFADKENADRRDLTPLQRARSWDYAIKAFHFGRQDMFASATGADRSVVSRTLAILKIPADVMAALKDPESVSVHFAEQIVPALQDPERARVICETARNLAQMRGPVPGPALIDALLSTPSERAERVPLAFDLQGSPKHAVFKRKRDGSATLSLKAIDAAQFDAKARKALLATLERELRKFLQVELKATGARSVVSGGADGEPSLPNS